MTSIINYLFKKDNGRSVSVVKTSSFPDGFNTKRDGSVPPLKNNQQIKGFVQLKGTDISEKEILITIPELKIKKKVLTNTQGIAFVEIKSKKINYWSTQNPYLYTVVLTTESDEIKDQIGFRTIKTKGQEILLNN